VKVGHAVRHISSFERGNFHENTLLSPPRRKVSFMNYNRNCLLYFSLYLTNSGMNDHSIQIKREIVWLLTSTLRMYDNRRTFHSEGFWIKCSFDSHAIERDAYIILYYCLKTLVNGY
jgi:hypothetical protein